MNPSYAELRHPARLQPGVHVLEGRRAVAYGVPGQQSTHRMTLLGDGARQATRSIRMWSSACMDCRGRGRDFDVLAEQLGKRARVICPDVAGRGESDWLQDPAGYQVPLYAADMLALLAQVHAQAPVRTLDWVGTSMVGLIGMVLAGQPGACRCLCRSSAWCSMMWGR